ncbi:MAG: hypothetical protein ABI442_16750, partial [Gemmatimonadaceae bacterium]
MKGIVRRFLGTVLFVAAPAKAWAICVASTGVFGAAVEIAPGAWNYSFSVSNGCVPDHQPLLTDFYLPYFSDAGYRDFILPAPDTYTYAGTVTWTETIDATNNLFGLAGAGVID